MNDIQLYNFNGNDIRITDRDGNPWFVARDVCQVLGIQQAHHAVGALDDDERDTVTVTDPIGRKQTTNIVSEPGLYSLIFRSRKPEAKEFKRWVTHEVLPSIRKTGTYTMEPVSIEDKLEMMAKGYLQERAKVKELEAHVEAVRPKVEQYDTFMDSDGLIKLSNLGRTFGLKPNKFVGELREKGILSTRTDSGRYTNEPRSQFIARGLFVVKARNTMMGFRMTWKCAVRLVLLYTYCVPNIHM